MKIPRVAVLLVLMILAMGVALPCSAGEAGYRTCVPDRPIPPESVGPISIPFDLPIWPTIVKTEFNILPWVSLGTASVCIPGTCKTIEFPAPCLSLKPIPVWFPWLRPLDAECKDSEFCRVP
jgi:hypothetical protein